MTCRSPRVLKKVRGPSIHEAVRAESPATTPAVIRKKAPPRRCITASRADGFQGLFWRPAAVSGVPPGTPFCLLAQTVAQSKQNVTEITEILSLRLLDFRQGIAGARPGTGDTRLQ